MWGVTTLLEDSSAVAVFATDISGTLAIRLAGTTLPALGTDVREGRVTVAP